MRFMPKRVELHLPPLPESVLAQAPPAPPTLAEVIAQKTLELRALQIQNIKENVSAFPLDKPELDAMLDAFSALSDELRLEISTNIETCASNRGITGDPFEILRKKLMRIGLIT